MKILIINYRYFISGGPERYMFNVIELLESNGHTVIPFSVKHSKNKQNNYEKYFLEPIGSGNETYYDDYNMKKLRTVIKVFGRMFFSFEAFRKMTLLIQDTKPDIVYILQYQNKISLSVISAAKRKGIPVVQRISDFGHICANNIFYLYNKKEICERCLKGSKINAIKNRCVKNSTFYSIIKVLSLKYQEILNIHSKIDAFVIPSKFTCSKFKEFGIPEKKIFHIPTFFNFNLISQMQLSYDNYAIYIGRIDQDKGLLTLIKAFENTPYNLKIIGASSSDYKNILENYLKDKEHHIEFLGEMEFSEAQKYLAHSLFTVVPSEWYDNMPNSLLESFALKKTAIVSNLGSLADLVEDNVTGIKFQAGNHIDLRKKADILFTNKELAMKLGALSYQYLCNSFSAEDHYQSLINLFHSLANK